MVWLHEASFCIYPHGLRLSPQGFERRHQRAIKPLIAPEDRSRRSEDENSLRHQSLLTPRFLLGDKTASPLFLPPLASHLLYQCIVSMRATYRAREWVTGACVFREMTRVSGCPNLKPGWSELPSRRLLCRWSVKLGFQVQIQPRNWPEPSWQAGKLHDC
jgi:hypothetical protein